MGAFHKKKMTEMEKSIHRRRIIIPPGIGFEIGKWKTVIWRKCKHKADFLSIKKVQLKQLEKKALKNYSVLPWSNGMDRPA
jgi:hypothetical protein